MRARAWSALSSSPASRDDAVSPVVGMILVLAISIVGTATILYWGLPAIDEMKANVEYRSVQGQFAELDATLKELAAGTTEKTANRWQPSLSRGEIAVRNGTEGWLFATEPYNASFNHDLGWSGFKDGDNAFTLHNLANQPLIAVKIECYTVSGTSSLTALNVSTSANDRAQMISTLVDPSGTKDFHLFVKNVGATTPVPLKDATFKCRVYTGSSLIAEAWYANVGAIRYNLHGGLGDRSIVANNGALMVGSGGSWSIVNSPSIPAQTTTAGTHRFFGRSLVLYGDSSFAGDHQFDLLVSLYSTSVLGSYDCASDAFTDCVETSKIFIYGDYQAPWHAYLTNAGKGYTFSKATMSLPGGGSFEYLVDRKPAMGYTLLQSTILMTG